MVQTIFRENAEKARAEADAATLDNVRDRCLRAEAAWIAMAERQERVDKARTDNRKLDPVAADRGDAGPDRPDEAVL